MSPNSGGMLPLLSEINTFSSNKINLVKEQVFRAFLDISLNEMDNK